MSKPNQPFILRLTATKAPAWLMGLLTSATFVLIQALIFQVEGIKHSYYNYSTIAYFTFTTGYLVFISRVIHNNHEKGFYKLLSFAGLKESQKDAYVSEFYNQRITWKEMLIPLGIGALHAYFSVFRWMLDGDFTYPTMLVYRGIQIIIIWVMIWQSTSTYLRNMTKMNKLSREIEIDILNTDRLMPLTSAGVISILAFIGAYTLLFIQGLNPTKFNNPALLPLIPSIIWMVITPLKGVRRSIIAAKEHEIALIEKGIDGDKEALLKSRIGKNLENINVVDLMTYKRLVNNTPEIPINIPTASRFIFYLVIPFLTWVAASVVDKAIDYLIS